MSAPTPEPRLNSELALTRAEPILKAQLRQLRGVKRCDKEDIGQTVRLRLWQTIIAKHDAQRGATLETFLHTAIRNAITDELRKLQLDNRQNRQLSEDIPDTDDQGGAAIEGIAADILAAPEQFLCPRRASLIRAIADHPTRNLTDIASGLGLTPRVVWNLIYHIRRELVAKCA